MERLTVAAAAVAAVATSAAAAAVAGSSLPTAISGEAAALAESVRECTLVVLANSCDGACMEEVEALLAPRCSGVTILVNMHMVSIRCADTPITAAAPPPPSFVVDSGYTTAHPQF